MWTVGWVDPGDKWMMVTTLWISFWIQTRLISIVSKPIKVVVVVVVVVILVVCFFCQEKLGPKKILSKRNSCPKRPKILGSKTVLDEYFVQN